MQDTGDTLTISGGTLVVDAQGDGLDSNRSITMTGGDVTVHGPTQQGNGALDSSGGIDVSGGTLAALGSTGMAESPDESSAQGWLAATVSGSAGSTVQITDASGAVIAQYTAEKTFGSVAARACLLNRGGPCQFPERMQSATFRRSWRRACDRSAASSSEPVCVVPIGLIVHIETQARPCGAGQPGEGGEPHDVFGVDVIAQRIELVSNPSRGSHGRVGKAVGQGEGFC